ncbi:MAG: hypothetical protein RLZZ504_339, partial [Bacteroidota bacterium]
MKNGFFLVALWSFALAMLTQRLGRSITLMAIQNQLDYSLPTDTIQAAGLSQDLSVSAYFTLLMLLTSVIPYRLIWLQLFQSLFIVLQGLLIAIDIQLLQTWNSRFNQLAINMLQFPEATLQSMSTAQLWRIILLLASIFAITILLAKGLQRLLNLPSTQFKFNYWLIAMVLPLVAATRGGLQKIPLNSAAAHFGTDPLQNAIATNPNWNLVALSQQPSLKERTDKALMDAGVEAFALQAYAGPDSFPGGLKRMPQIIRRGSNVLFVVLEGINQHWLETKQATAESSKYLDGFHTKSENQWEPRKTAMPNLVKLAQDGMWFKRAYATGDRTDKGL